MQSAKLEGEIRELKYSLEKSWGDAFYLYVFVPPSPFIIIYRTTPRSLSIRGCEAQFLWVATQTTKKPVFKTDAPCRSNLLT